MQINPSACCESESDGGRVLNENQVNAWRTEGCVAVDGIFSDELIQEVRAAAMKVFPDGTGPLIDDFGANGALCFPTVREDLACVNSIPIHERLIRAVGELLGCTSSGLRLTQADLWGKRGSADKSNGCMSGAEELEEDDGMPYLPFCNADQRIHCDYPNHSLVMPPPWESPEVVSIIVYYDDSAVTGGQTSVVPRTGPHDPAYAAQTPLTVTSREVAEEQVTEMVTDPLNQQQQSQPASEPEHPLLLTPGARGDLVWINDRQHAEQHLLQRHPEVSAFRRAHLYPREQKVMFRTGTVLFYRHDVWHRGTPLLLDQTRRSHNIVFRRAECDWVTHWNSGTARGMYEQSQIIEKLIAQSKSCQRSVLGFPAPESAYWTEQTFSWVRQRYGRLPGGFLHTAEIEEALRRRREREQREDEEGGGGEKLEAFNQRREQEDALLEYYHHENIDMKPSAHGVNE